MPVKYRFRDHAVCQQRRYSKIRYEIQGSNREMNYHDRRKRNQPVRLDDRIDDIADLTLAKLNNPDRYLRSFKRSKSDMGLSAGTDGVRGDENSIPELAEALRRLSRTIGDGSFVPNDHRQVQLPKPNGKFRTLSIPVFAERVVSRSFNNALLDVLDARFPDSFHAYRRNRGILTLIASIARAYDPAKPLFIGTADIENAFPTTPKAAVADSLSEYVPDEALRNTLLRFSYPRESQLGLPQGLATSPTLFTMVASHVLNRGSPESGHDATTLLTYSDNLVYVGSAEESIMEAHRQHTQELEAIGMRFKADQPLAPVNIAEGPIDILGTTIFTRKGRIAFRPGPDGWNKLRLQIRDTYLHPYISAGAWEAMSGWISRNRHIVHSFGAPAIVNRLRNYCTQANILDVPWDAITNASEIAAEQWQRMVEGHHIPIPLEPETWQYR
jgi:Reverse transcriptase (RNA-dependent DNA polymerase)